MVKEFPARLTGGSRLLKELGIPGILLLLICFNYFFSALKSSMGMIPARHPAQSLQVDLLSVVIANGGSFIVSHQQYSGDPVSSLMVLVILGAVFGAPRLAFIKKASPRQEVPITEPPLAPLGSVT